MAKFILIACLAALAYVTTGTPLNARSIESLQDLNELTDNSYENVDSYEEFDNVATDSMPESLHPIMNHKAGEDALLDGTMAHLGSPRLTSAHHRSRRQTARDLALNHSDYYGNPRRVFRPHGYVRQAESGVGAVVHRSPSGRHTFGVGATVNRGFNPTSFNTRPNYGVGLGYRFSF